MQGIHLSNPSLSKATSNKAVSDKSAILSAAYQGEMFSNRDEGLACFNILDHLRDTSEPGLHAQNSATEESSLTDSNPSKDKPILDLKQLREEHIRKSVSPNGRNADKRLGEW